MNDPWPCLCEFLDHPDERTYSVFVKNMLTEEAAWILYVRDVIVAPIYLAIYQEESDRFCCERMAERSMPFSGTSLQCETEFLELDKKQPLDFVSEEHYRAIAEILVDICGWS